MHETKSLTKLEERNTTPEDDEMVRIKVKGDFKNTENLLKRITNRKKNLEILNRYAQKGVEALAAATPVNTGKTAASWGYDINYYVGKIKIVWTNSNVNDGVPIAVILQYGHATGSGGYVEGLDYINPAMRPIFQEIADELWREVTGA